MYVASIRSGNSMHVQEQGVVGVVASAWPRRQHEMGALKIIVLASLAGCRSARIEGAVRPAASAAIEITVASAQDTTILLPDVEAFAVEDGHLVLIGRTDQFGDIRISTNILPHSTALLFCHELFFCGAIRVKKSSLSEYREYFITLVPSQCNRIIL